MGLAGLGSGGVVIPIRRWARSRPEDRGAGRQSFPQTFCGPGAAPQARPAALRGLGGLHTPRQAPFPALWPDQALYDPLRARWARIRQLPGAGHRSSCPRPQGRPTGSPWRRQMPSPTTGAALDPVQREQRQRSKITSPRPRANTHGSHSHSRANGPASLRRTPARITPASPTLTLHSGNQPPDLQG